MVDTGFATLRERDACGVGFVATTDRAPSHRILALALEAVARLAHRGGIAADGTTGDGAGLLLDIPHDLLSRDMERRGVRLPGPGDLGVAACFLPRQEAARRRAEELLAEACRASGLELVAWRDVPVDPSVLGPIAAASLPAIRQALVARPAGVAPGLAFERALYLARRRFERAVREAGLEAGPVYVCSMSSRTVVYKGLLTGPALRPFYRDLQDPGFATRFAIFHLRYSTNTLPTWERAQPFRLLAHNGEINTLQGNVNGMTAREPILAVPDWPEAQGDLIRPVIDRSGSDSAMLDNVVELFRLAGRDLVHVLEMLVPQAWEGIPDLEEELRHFYRFHACLSEPWDGPAALVFSDGAVVGAHLDRNGLRPMRYAIQRDGVVWAASEAGAIDADPAQVVRFGKLGPGQTVAVDLETGEVLEDEAIKRRLADRRPYGRWLEAFLVTPARVAQEADPSPPAAVPPEELPALQTAFGYTREEMTVILRPMLETGAEPTGSMGDDTPHAVLSQMRRPLYHYFKQRFAQVTNPAIDHLREKLVFSLTTRLGPQPNPLVEAPEQARRIEWPTPVLLEEDLERLRAYGERDHGFRTVTLSTLFDAREGADGLARALERLEAEAVAAVDAGYRILILSDRGVDAERAAVPALLATGAVHHHLIRTGRRVHASLVVESGEPREVHHLATLIGYGAAAVCPYLALATVRQLARELGVDPAEAVQNFKRSLEHGLMKIMSKMGISTVDAYTGAQIFEALGLEPELVERCFAGTPSPVGGIGLREIAEDVLHWHRLAFGERVASVEGYGFYKFKKGGEFHEFNPDAIRTLHVALKKATTAGNGAFPLAQYEYYRAFKDLVEASPPSQLRHLLELRSDRAPIPVEEVEPVERIVRRFSTGAMSLGALSPEAHETLAIAMNRLGGRSNSGEGGEDPERYGTERNSAIKQVASGRFGVTPAYLASAVEIQIKIAQGSKPGEGGQIPGNKVTPLIARLRFTQPGIPLISPPPHHDIYSIEDLAQLIYDLKQANPEALVSVKLVAETGVGIIAAGVAKGYADIVVIAGCSGGTGASPWSSIKNAGMPWELGLAETQQVLVENGLRHRVVVRVDGGLKTGRDVLVAALLGADEYSFGTAALIAEGCVMARICNTNKCPVGVATQDPELRKRFTGTPEQVMAYFLFIAQEVRELLAQLGYRSLDEVIGRADLLVPRRTGNPRADRLDLRPLIVPAGSTRPAAVAACAPLALRCTEPRNPLPEEDSLGRRVAREALPAVEARTPWEATYPITNRDRTVGATLAWEIARRYGDAGLPEGTIRLRFEGVAGQSFGAFNIRGVRLELVGQANDYVGKGMAGGEIVVVPHPAGPAASEDHVLVGNTVLYGATGGRLFVAGAAGERFAIRNSGATAVVEGVGDHACEYMTGGTVVVLGRTGRNFGAGMTGGEAFVYDPDGRFALRHNTAWVRASQPDEEALERVRGLIAEHLRQTGSRRAAWILEHWAEASAHILHVLPTTKPAFPAEERVAQAASTD